MGGKKGAGLMLAEIEAVRVVALTATDEARRLPEHSQIRRFLIMVGAELMGFHARLEREGTNAPVRSTARALKVP